MTGHEPFERDLETALAPERAPDQLYRRVAQIPLDHPRGARASLWQRLFGTWFSPEAAPWATGLAAAAASLAIGLWLGAAGVVGDGDSPTDDGLVAVVYSGLPSALGDAL